MSLLLCTCFGPISNISVLSEFYRQNYWSSKLFISLAHFDMLHNLEILFLIYFERGCMSIENSSGPKIGPCGTPYFASINLGNFLFK